MIVKFIFESDRLDGIVKKKLEKPASMEDWLQSGLPDDYDYNFDQKPMDGKKRVIEYNLFFILIISLS